MAIAMKTTSMPTITFLATSATPPTGLAPTLRLRTGRSHVEEVTRTSRAAAAGSVLAIVLSLAGCASTGEPVAPAAPAAAQAETDIAMTRFAEVLPGVRAGGQPTAADLALLQAQGVRTVIDLRGEGEDRGYDEATEARRLGLAYVALPIAGKDGITPANAGALQALLAEHGDGVLLHCASGNRAGALLALGGAMAGLPHEDALALGRKAGLTAMEPLTVERLQALPPAGEAAGCKDDAGEASRSRSGKAC